MEINIQFENGDVEIVAVLIGGKVVVNQQLAMLSGRLLARYHRKVGGDKAWFSMAGRYTYPDGKRL